MNDNVHKLKTPLRNLTPELCEKLQTQMLAACRNVADEYGLSVQDEGLKDLDLRTGFALGLRVGIPQQDGSIFEPEKAKFELLAQGYGLKPEDFGREFSNGNETFRIVGIETRRPKYPINVERISDGRGYKFFQKPTLAKQPIAPHNCLPLAGGRSRSRGIGTFCDVFLRLVRLRALRIHHPDL